MYVNHVTWMNCFCPTSSLILLCSIVSSQIDETRQYHSWRKYLYAYPTTMIEGANRFPKMMLINVWFREMFQYCWFCTLGSASPQGRTTGEICERKLAPKCQIWSEVRRLRIHLRLRTHRPANGALQQPAAAVKLNANYRLPAAYNHGPHRRRSDNDPPRMRRMNPLFLKMNNCCNFGLQFRKCLEMFQKMWQFFHKINWIY